MAWFKVDDQFWSHPKVIRCSTSAVALWVRAGSWAAQQLTDGQVPAEVLPMMRATKRTAHELVSAGLWEATTTGWRFHDWGDMQPSAQQVTEQKLKRAEAGRKGGRRSSQRRLEEANGQANGQANA
ncbi:hypothetical protein FAM15346_001824 [Propionibacterium freudenreichii]|uniref:hypothetical protein n=1 Tax=Propionibacterium freudenreichii TaxID=1744 RepID=UPI000AE8C800|nr:hypothetical protein [Propionibacterium freudenreichii]MCT2983720.1 hypothetical protein [Propionibacterium freudenreichii]MDK9644758.1 hypothetical protein [Propionibacterium freudenreichii]SCQ72828.1 Hypothetical protein PFR_JS17-1_2064 [Propionibacterium freudenreichii]SCQ81325.1 Hypothetical protein PFR_JS17-2_2063 [Propionibacterium freudenreichii]